MCLKPEKIYEKDQEFLNKIRDKEGLKSRAMALRKIILLFKKHKMEAEL